MSPKYRLAPCPECQGRGGWINPFDDYGEECEMCDGLGTIKVAPTDPHLLLVKDEDEIRPVQES